MPDLALLSGILLALSLVAMGMALRFRFERNAERNRATALDAALDEVHDRLFQLQESELRSAALLDSLGDLIVRRSREGEFRSANSAFQGALDDDGQIHVLERSEEQCDADGVVTVDEHILTPQGERWIAWRHVPVRDDMNRLNDILSVGRDITERKQTEAALAKASREAQDASGAKSRFLATVSHEIRTPMNGILGMADLLGDTKLSPEQQAYVAAIKTSGDALLSLIEHVLDFSKIESGRLDLEESEFELRAMVEGVIELLAPRAQGKGLDIACAIAPGVPQRILADASRLRQVLINLVGNAVKFTSQGGVVVTLRREDESLVLAVRDTGPGINAVDQQRIFAEFEQAEDGLARTHGGTGLGLAISRQIVERMGGAITLQSEPGQGATFSASIPLKAGTAVSEDAERLDGVSVLCLSKSPVEMAVISYRLKCRGADVLRLDSLDDLPEGRHWDRVLLDQRMGDEALKAAIDALKDRARRIVLVVTPAARSQIAHWRQNGANGWLVSPVREASLLAQVRAGEADASTFDPLTDTKLKTTATASAPAKALNVLLAEDNEINALLARTLLTKLGHKVVHVADGEAAVEAACNPAYQFDLILLDVQMPKRDGLTAARDIRSAETGRRRMIVALTANAFVEDREAAFAAGMDGFLTKPLQRDRLAELVDMIIQSESPAARVPKKARKRR